MGISLNRFIHCGVTSPAKSFRRARMGTRKSSARSPLTRPPNVPLPPHSDRASTSAPKNFATAGLNPPVDTAKVTGPRRTTDGTTKIAQAWPVHHVHPNVTGATEGGNFLVEQFCRPWRPPPAKGHNLHHPHGNHVEKPARPLTVGIPLSGEKPLSTRAPAACKSAVLCKARRPPPTTRNVFQKG